MGAPIQTAHWDTQVDPFAWNTPLTAEGFAEWRSSLSERKDDVRRSGELLMLDTSTEENLIKEARLVVRAADFHPIDQYIRFAHNGELDLTEIAFEVRDVRQATVNTVPAVVGAARSQRAPTSATVVPTEEELSNTELALRYTLFVHRWDPGEDMIIGRASDGVTLSGTISSLESAQAIRAVLAKIPHLQLSIQPPATSRR